MRPVAGSMSAGDCAQQRGLSSPVRADQGQGFAGLDLEGHAADGLEQSVPRLQLLDGKQTHDALVPPM